MIPSGYPSSPLSSTTVLPGANFNLDIQTLNLDIYTLNLDVNTLNLDIQTLNLDIQTTLNLDTNLKTGNTDLINGYMD